MSRFILLLTFVIANAVIGNGQVDHPMLWVSRTDDCRISCGNNDDLPLTDVNGGLYYFHLDKTKKKNWYEAYDFCRQHNMELATIETSAENEAIKEKINALIPDENDVQSFFWIGLNDLGKEGEYRWSSTGKVTHLTDWHARQPDNYNGAEDCGEIWKLPAVTKWNDRDCTSLAGNGMFICEVPSNRSAN